MIYLLLAFQLALILDMRRRMKGFNPPEMASWFLWVSEIVYINSDFFFQINRDNAPFATYSFSTHPERLLTYYTFVVLMFAVSTIGVKPLSTSITELRQTMAVIMRRIVMFEPFLAGLVLTFIGIELSVLNWDIIFHNNTYMMMASPDAIKIEPPLGSLLQSVVNYSALISGMFVGLCLNRRFNAYTIIWISALTWQLAFTMAGCSRSTAVNFGVVIIFSSLFSQRPHRFRLATMLLMAVWFYCSALAGRGQSEFGLTALPSILASPLSLEAKDWIAMLSSIFQGAWITGDGLDYTANFNPIYAMLSFSPLPSVIDNFSTYLTLYEIRLNLYVPMGAQTEVIFFGPGYTALFWGTIFALSRTLVKNKNNLGLFYYFGTAFFLVTFMSSGAYQTRNVYRTFIILLLVGMYMANRNRKAAIQRPVRFAPPSQETA